MWTPCIFTATVNQMFLLCLVFVFSCLMIIKLLFLQAAFTKQEWLNRPSLRACSLPLTEKVTVFGIPPPLCGLQECLASTFVRHAYKFSYSTWKHTHTFVTHQLLFIRDTYLYLVINKNKLKSQRKISFLIFNMIMQNKIQKVKPACHNCATFWRELNFFFSMYF